MERNRTDNIAYFIAFCIEMYKKSHSLTGISANNIFMKNDLHDYLAENFDVLHTQSPRWILEEIDEVIKRHSA
ncbi:MAG: DUF3791 domain-containing protein [Bacteroides sp.]|nr:DUF3791 domain-containing protein [Bacteroides sp.]